MIERLRALRDRPLDPEVARAVTLLALSVALGLVVLAVLAGIGGGPSRTPVAERAREAGSKAIHAPGDGLANVPAQDPQDRIGTAAHRRAARELARHRALQHVPFERDGASIDLVGARGARAVLRVRATSVAAARRAWKAFLRRYRDPGAAYVPIFQANRTRRES